MDSIGTLFFFIFDVIASAVYPLKLIELPEELATNDIRQLH
jgi:hypothetical protein